MVRVGLLALAGWALGAGLAVALLGLTRQALLWYTAPKQFDIEHTAVYLAVALGAASGAVCGALAGLAGTPSRRDGSGR